MKGAYSLRATEESLAACDDRIRAAYARPFESLGIEFVVAPVESDLLGIPRKIVLGNHVRETGRVELESRDGDTTDAKLEHVSELF